VARQSINLQQYIAVLRDVVRAMAIPKADREAILGGLERFTKHCKNRKQYAARTPEQRARAIESTRRWRARQKLAAAENLASVA
jgi:hypothetical protein